jgi:predicted permease
VNLGLVNLVNDLRYSLRVLSQKPGFTITAVLVLALGIGANTAMFTVIDATLLQPLPYADAGRLVNLFERDVIDDHNQFNIVSPPNFRDWQRQSTSYVQMAAFRVRALNLSGSSGKPPERIEATMCTYNLFSTLGVQPPRGRRFLSEDDRPAAQRVAIVSQGLWQRLFAGSPDVLGRSLRLNGENHIIVGVMPSWFRYPTGTTQVWVPLYRQADPKEMEQRGNHQLTVLGKLKPGVAAEQARAELDGIAKQIKRQHPEALTGAGANVVSLKERTVSGVRTLLLVLLGAVGLVLLIACVNVTNLFLARAVGRRREVAIRLALGATRVRLIRQFLVESVTISILGGAAGLLVAAAGVKLLASLAGNLPRAEAIQVDVPVLLFTAAIALLAGVLSGLAPALSTSDLSLASAVHEGGRSTTGSRKANRLRQVLVVGEVALSTVLLIGAGLLIKSFERLRSVDPGFPATRALTMSLSLPDTQYKTPAQVTAFFENLSAKVKSLPGVESLGMVTKLPLQGIYEDRVFDILGRPSLPGQTPDAMLRAADPGYFQTMGIPLKRGRVFTTADRLEKSGQIVISESLADRFFRGQNPLGQKIRFGPVYEIIGIVGDVRKDLVSEPEPTMYVPLLSGEFSYGTIVVRTALDPNALALPIQKEVSRLDPDLPVIDVLTTDELLSQAASPRRFGLTLLVVFAGLAAVLAAVGLYGVLSYTMGQRRSELGIRMALGATGRDMMRLALRQGMRPTAIGIVAGLLVALWLTRVMESLLFHVSATDPQVFAIVAILLSAVALSACLGPALRAARIDPVTALRVE